MKEAKNRSTELARLAEDGQTVTITRRCKPVADLVPHRKRMGPDLEGGTRFLQEHAIQGAELSTAPDFDKSLPEDFLLRPLP